ncbi:MAG: hypothetical protein M1830_002031 [Pleopsidium flavum]|nr:MAG: hypothetical protein M1830_002031 [Pleopsidium flavum]
MVEIKEAHKVLGLLEIPGEIRNKVYRELLITDKVRNKDGICILEPAILRTCRQIHKEASTILYGENKWVVFTFNFHGFVGAWKRAGFPILSTNHINSIQSPALKVDYRDHYFLHQYAQEYFVVTEYDLPAICRAFWGDQKLDHAEFTITLNVRDESCRREMQLQLLDPFREVRGVGGVKVVGAQPSSWAEQLQVVMKTPLTKFEDVYERAYTYQQRGDKYMVLGRLEDMSRYYIGGCVYIDSCIRSSLQKLEGGDAEGKWAAFMSIKCAMLSSLGLYCIKQRRYQGARGFLQMALKIPTLSRDEKAKAFYHLGLAQVAGNEDNPAIYSFMRALKLVPGYPAVEQELDAMEERNKGTNNGLIEQNLVFVAGPYRHRDPAETESGDFPDLRPIEDEEQEYNLAHDGEETDSVDDVAWEHGLDV